MNENTRTSLLRRARHYTLGIVLASLAGTGLLTAAVASTGQQAGLEHGAPTTSTVGGTAGQAQSDPAGTGGSGILSGILPGTSSGGSDGGSHSS